MAESTTPKKSRRGSATGRAGRPSKFSKATMSMDVRLGLLTSLNYGGTRWPSTMAPPPGVSPNAIDFWLKLKRSQPAKFAECLMKCVRTDDAGSLEGVTFIVRSLQINNAQPVPGVLASPIAAHVQPLKLVSNGDVVEDAQPVREGTDE
jgi:hypothetical protein